MTDMSASPPASSSAVLVVGESLIDAVERGSEPPELHVGGSPANVAFGLAALEHDVSLATWFGRDDWGRRIADRCAEKGAKVVEGSDGAARTSVARAVLDASGAATYDFDITWQLPALSDLDRYGHVHTGSIAAVLEPGGSQTLVTVQQARRSATISYDPNVRPSLMGSPDEVRPRIEALVALADVVKASDEDIAWLYRDRFVPDVLRHWGLLGASLTVVTRGGEGALYALHHVGSLATCDARGEGLVDTVGAGDSFMAGLLSGLLDAGLLGTPEARERLAAATLRDVRPAVERAVTTGGITVSRAGAYSPGRAEL
ncbi:MAG TPA: PfkB family carbohydrate kinase [Lapillicoccus sp.]|jgi:fructokinase|nr:PfkB family carbohydrate kinase [Lapillicoccus sp.]